MPQVESIYAKWNPWHGCTKLSAGCKYCYVYRQDAMYGTEEAASVCRKTASFDLPVKKKRDGSWKLPSGKVIFTCFTSDFLLSDADPWRQDCWDMIRRRQDCFFYFFTKRIDRLSECLPPGWGGGYENVIIGCTVENQEMADYRLPIFLALPIRHRAIIAAPLLTPLDISVYLDSEKIEESLGQRGIRRRRAPMSLRLDPRASAAVRGARYLFPVPSDWGALRQGRQDVPCAAPRADRAGQKSRYRLQGRGSRPAAVRAGACRFSPSGAGAAFAAMTVAGVDTCAEYGRKLRRIHRKP